MNAKDIQKLKAVAIGVYYQIVGDYVCMKKNNYPAQTIRNEYELASAMLDALHMARVLTRTECNHLQDYFYKWFYRLADQANV